MLTLLDGILTFLFYRLPPLVFGLGVGVFAVLALVALLQIKSDWRMVEVAAGCLVMSALCFSFFPYRASFANVKSPPPTVEKRMADGSSQIVPMESEKIGVMDNVLAMLLVSLSGVGVIILRAIQVPFVVIVFVVWGIVLRGW